MVNMQHLMDDAKCFAVIREVRWPDGVIAQNVGLVRLTNAVFNLLTPYPGTQLYNEFLQEGRLSHPHWWLDPNYTYGSAVFKPKNISAYELEQGRLSLYGKFYSPTSMLKRLWEPKANLQDLW